MKFIGSLTQTTNWEKEIPAGIYKGIHLRFSGTNLSGQTMAIGDIGTLTFSINGQQTHFVPTGALADILNQWHGYVESSSTAGSSFAFGLFLPFEFPGFKNGLHVSPGDNAFIGLQVASAVATKVSSWTIEINGVYSNELENYILKMLPANQSYSGAITLKERIPNENILSVYVYSTTVTRVALDRDGEQLHECSYNALISETSLRRSVEDSAITYGELLCGEQVSDMLSDDVQLQLTTSGSGTATVVYVAVGFDRKRRSQSVQQKISKVSARLAPITSKRPADVEVAKMVEVAE